MSEKLWTAVEDYITSQIVRPDDAVNAALQYSQSADLPPINVTPNLGKLLHLLAKLANAKHILEIGTLGGYSAIWLASALPPGGQLVTLEVDAKHAEVARANIARAGLSQAINIHLGPALDTLPKLAAQNQTPFDFTFIDADKENCVPYFRWAIKLSRPGGLIIVDNVVRKGEILDAASGDSRVQGVRRLFEFLAHEKRVTATALQTVGAKDHDGIVFALINR